MSNLLTQPLGVGFIVRLGFSGMRLGLFDFGNSFLKGNARHGVLTIFQPICGHELITFLVRTLSKLFHNEIPDLFNFAFFGRRYSEKVATNYYRTLI